MLCLQPALEFLTTSEENGPLRFSLWQLCIWSAIRSILGVAIAFPLRTYFIIRERLRFPIGTSTAVLIGFLHKDASIVVNMERANKTGGDRTKQSISVLEDDLQPTNDYPNNFPGSMDDAVWKKNNLYLLCHSLSQLFTHVCICFPRPADKN